MKKSGLLFFSILSINCNEPAAAVGSIFTATRFRGNLQLQVCAVSRERTSPHCFLFCLISIAGSRHVTVILQFV